MDLIHVSLAEHHSQQLLATHPAQALCRLPRMPLFAASVSTGRLREGDESPRPVQKLSADGEAVSSRLSTLKTVIRQLEGWGWGVL